MRCWGRFGCAGINGCGKEYMMHCGTNVIYCNINKISRLIELRVK